MEAADITVRELVMPATEQDKCIQEDGACP
jgi:hypothetical protein